MSWGTSTWGGTSVTTKLLSVVIGGPRWLTVTFDGAPRALSAYVIGDALARSSWRVEQLTLGARVFFVVAIERVSLIKFRVELADQIGPKDAQHRVTVTGILSENGGPLLQPNYLNFSGLDVTPVLPKLDVLTPRDLKAAPLTGLGGLSIGPGSDYELESGDVAVRNRIIRMLLTDPGAFFHLPGWGFGLKAKRTYRPADLALLQSRIREAVKKDPDVQDAAVTVVLSASTLTVKLGVKTFSGRTIPVVLPPIGLEP